MKSCQQTDCTLNIIQYTNRTNQSDSIRLEYLTKSWIPWKSVVNWAISFFLVLATGTIFFGNLLIILAFITNNRLRRITDQYIVSLAVADLLVAILVLPLAIVRQNLGSWPFESDRLCQFWLSANIVLCMASILNLCCISLDRYIAITHPMKYFIKRTRLTASAMIAFAWILPLIIMLPPIVGGNQHTLGPGSCHITYNKAYRIYSSIAGFFGPFLLIAYVYLRVFIVIKRRLKVLNGTSIKSLSQKNFKSNIETISKPRAVVTNLKHIFENIKKKAIRNNNVQNHSNESKGICLYSRCKFQSDEFLYNHIFRDDRLNQKQLTNCFENDFSIKIHDNHDDLLNVKINKKDSKTSIKILDYFQINSTQSANRTTKVIQILHVSTPEKESQKLNRNCLPNFSLINESKQILHQDQYNRTFKKPEIEQKDKHFLSSPKSLTSNHQEKCLHLKSLPSLKTEYDKTKLPQKNIIYCRHDQLTFHREQKTTRILAAVVGCFTLCWFPFFIYMIGEAICDCQYSDSLLTFVTWLGYFNSICNPFIYAFFNKEYSKAFKCILRVNKWNIQRRINK
ncbi:Tyramine/octopamine receptor [Schistosoma japonicum]|uniref:Tyramine/octopamine receptor n=1 Tax=Schistosoma japonicum TaxID=6182 RepID=A0A4Z2DNX8_SCHJA|nr:Tyramine/octopamine receptor [Schistosoma japonicum]